MGTDIHYEFHKLNKEGKWEEIDVETSYGKGYYISRHYLLFSILADVRNGYGFAGCTTYKPVVPISKPRGIPQDVDELVYDSEYDEYYNRYGDHSYSWLTSTEILEYFEKNKDEVTSYSGVISKEDFVNWDLKTPPETYSGDIMGRDILVNYLPYDFRKAQKDIEEKISYYTHFQIEWDFNILNEVVYFKDMISKLQDTYGEIRMVFGFDS